MQPITGAITPKRKLASVRTPLTSVVLFVAAFVSHRGDAAAQAAPRADSAKVAVIRQILNVTHAADQMVGAIETSVPAQRASNPRIPAVFWDRFLVQARARRSEFIDSLVPLYSRTFELAELKALLQFYQGPLGHRLVEAQPNLTRESLQLGQRWGARIGADVGQQLAAEGVQIQP
jgi:hypothetical protein